MVTTGQQRVVTRRLWRTAGRKYRPPSLSSSVPFGVCRTTVDDGVTQNRWRGYHRETPGGPQCSGGGGWGPRITHRLEDLANKRRAKTKNQDYKSFVNILMTFGHLFSSLFQASISKHRIVKQKNNNFSGPRAKLRCPVYSLPRWSVPRAATPTHESLAEKTDFFEIFGYNKCPTKYTFQLRVSRANFARTRIPQRPFDVAKNRYAGQGFPGRNEKLDGVARGRVENKTCRSIHTRVLFDFQVRRCLSSVAARTRKHSVAR